jgi:ribonuclease-3
LKLHRRIEAVQGIVNHQFQDEGLVVAALTHPSAAEGKDVSASYERLEFLGDAILGAVIAEEVYTRFPSMDEGQLTDLKIALVSGKTLSAASESLGLAQLIMVGESEAGTHGRGMRSALEDVFEALGAPSTLTAAQRRRGSSCCRCWGPPSRPRPSSARQTPRPACSSLPSREPCT